MYGERLVRVGEIGREREINMSEHETEMKFAAHLQTKEGSGRLDAAVKRRDMADYECFMVLRELADEGALNQAGLMVSLLKAGLEKEEAEEAVTEFTTKILACLRERREADNDFMHASRGTNA